MKRVRLIDVTIIVAVAVLVVSTLAPAVARMQRTISEARCQSNLQRLAEAMTLYLADNNHLYTTNRNRSTGSLAYYQSLSPPENDPATGKPMRLTYSVNWIEGLYTYLWDRAEKTGQDWKTFRACPNKRPGSWPLNAPADVYPYPCVTYTLNYNLTEQPVTIVRDPRTLMMFREYPKATIAQLRPANTSLANSENKPIYPFCNGDFQTTTEENTDPSYWKLHGEGSYIVFADGHVQYFPLDYFPKNSEITATTNWDEETQQWWNYAPGSGRGAPYLKSIAITP